MGRLSRWLRNTRRPLPDLAGRIACFREILHANNAALGFIADIQVTLEGSGPVAAADVARMVTGVTVQTYRMVSNLLKLTGGVHKNLLHKFNDIKTRLAGKIELTPTLQPVGLVVPLGSVGPSCIEAVGQKSAYLGEARRILPAHVPDGFATTVEAYHAFMEFNRLGDRIDSAMTLLGSSDVAAVFEESARIVQAIERAPVPDGLVRALESSAAALPGGSTLRLAVRSSALQEGGTAMSFAGQYRSLLNIPPDGLVDAFRRVIASKYSPQAITYRQQRGYQDAEVAMCCCVLAMVDAAAAGVLYTEFPTSFGVKTILQAVHGLGLSAVDGSAEPSTYVLDRAAHKVLSATVGRQDFLLRRSTLEGTEKVALASEIKAVPAVTVQQALAVSELAWQLEADLGMPLDIEWAIDQLGAPFVVQVRPLSDVRIEKTKMHKAVVSGAVVLIERGSRASGGAGSGPVCHVSTDLDILRCPHGSVIVVREANPRFAVLLPKAAAMVADTGEVTGHLATVARELRVPALFATRSAAVLVSGSTVTVDADAGVVYAGRVEAALVSARLPADRLHRDPNRERLQSVSDLIIPLTMRDRLASGYSCRKCRTLHDMIRFCHQATIEAMFDLGDKALRSGGALRQLISLVPIDCRVFDLGGGLQADTDEDRVTLEEVRCRPMRQLWKGMTDPRLRWRQVRPVSLRGFMSAVVDYNFDQDARLRPMGEPSYAFISAEYLNLNSRIGYHFSTIDARIGDTIESNYASFRFVGGSTGIDQRSRRARLIQRLLAPCGFETDCRADLVNARIRHRPPEEMDEALFKVGLLMGYVNHLDMALVSDGVMDLYVEAFLAGNYGFKGGEDITA